MAQVRRIGLSRAGFAVGVAVSSLLLAAACGSDSGSGSGSGSTGGTVVQKDTSVASLVPQDIADRGSVTVGTDPSYAPNEFVNTSSQAIEGMDVDLGHALGDVMGVKWNFEKSSFDSIIPSIQSGRFDIGMSSFTDTLEREQVVDFVTYFIAGTSFYTAASGGPTITGLSSLCGLTVGVEKGTTQADDATAQGKKCTAAGKSNVTVSVFPDQNGANLALSSGRVKVVMADSPVAAYAVKESGGKFKLSSATYGTAPYGIAIARPKGTPPGQAPMTKAVLAALKKLQANGTYNKILKQWGVQAGALDTPQVNGATS